MLDAREIIMSITKPRTAEGVLQNKFDTGAALERCRKYRKRILEISQQVSALHVAPAFSCLEMVDVIYNAVMRTGSDGAYEDIFLMSKGHGCVIQYVILEEQGVLSRSDLDNYCMPSGRLGAHPDYGTPGIAASTGSLGHGLGMGVGQAYAEKLKGSDSRIFCVLSDGEFQEGSTWEAMMMAANLKLGNLVVLMDNNDFSGLERMSEGHHAFYPLIEKAQAFGWDAIEVAGHDSERMFEALSMRTVTRPTILVCKTVKGKGVSYMEHVPLWHYRSPNPNEYSQALTELEAAR